MRLVYTMSGRDYVPLRAVPVITSGAITARRLAHMISDPDAFCDSEYDEVISPFLWKDDGRLLPVDHQAFGSATRLSATPLAPALLGGDRFPPGMLVLLTPVREKHRVLIHTLSGRAGAKLSPLNTVLDLEPTLTAAERALVLEGLPAPRSNSASLILADLSAAMSRVERSCSRCGFPINRAELPGTSKHWRPVLESLVPKARGMSPATFKDKCHAIGMGWKQGVDRRAVASLAAALKASGIYTCQEGWWG